MLIDKKHVVLEACVEMRFQAQFEYDVIMVAVNMGVDAV